MATKKKPPPQRIKNPPGKTVVVQGVSGKQTYAKKRAAKKRANTKAGPQVNTTKIARMLPELIPENLVPEPGTESWAYLRFAAQIHYTTDLQGTTVEKMHKHPMFSRVPLSTLQAWSKHDKWVMKRKEVLEKWRAQIERTVGERLVQARIQALERVTKIRDRLLKKLEEENSLMLLPADKAVNALVKLMQMEWDMSEVVLGTILPKLQNAPGQPTDDGTIPHVPRLSPEEARDAAKAILASRRKMMRGQSDEEEDDGSDYPSP